MTKEEALAEQSRLRDQDRQQIYAAMDANAYRQLVNAVAAGEDYPPKPTPQNTEWPGPEMCFAEPLTFWWRWFAWYPVKTWDGRWRWLSWVQRRRLQTKEHLTPPTSAWFQYRVLP